MIHIFVSSLVNVGEGEVTIMMPCVPDKKLGFSDT